MEHNFEVNERLLKLSPKLASKPQWIQHVYRGKIWMFIYDDIGDQYYHISPKAVTFIKLLDGKTTIKEALEKVNTQFPENKITIHDVLELLEQLKSFELLKFSTPGSEQYLYLSWKKKQKNKKINVLFSLLSIKVSLFNPNKLLDKIEPYISLFFNKYMLFLWSMSVVFALLLSISKINEFVEYSKIDFLSPTNLILLWVLYPTIKLCHEFGHALGIKLFKGNVYDMGIIFLVFIPIPYVNANSATQIFDKYKRILVSAMGIMVELLLCSLAVFVWIIVEPGWVKVISFDIIVLTGLSTLLFNGNPLLKFDGYYILSDLIEIPNLAQRSQLYWKYLFKKNIFRLKNTSSPLVTPSEQPWLVGFGVLSYLYRLYIGFVIAIYLASSFMFVGVALGIYVLGINIVKPIINFFRFLLWSPELIHTRNKTLMSLSIVCVCVLAGVFLLPFPHYTVANGVVLLDEASILRTKVDGEVSQVYFQSGDYIEKGDPIVQLSNPQLSAKINILNAQKEEFELLAQVNMLKNIENVYVYKQKAKSVQKIIDEMRLQLDRLTVRGQNSGYLEIKQEYKLNGRYLRKGEMIGYINNGAPAKIRVAIDESRLPFIREDLKEVLIQDYYNPNKTLKANLIGIVPQGHQVLPSSTLGSLSGGQIEVDPRDLKGLTTLQPIFEVDIEPKEPLKFILGKRVYCRFQHSDLPLGARLLQNLRQLLLSILSG